MCVRLYPDIIVAAEINNYICFYGDEKPIIISIVNLLAHQREYTKFGFRKPFIGYEGKVWDKDDYLAYFRKLPQYFEEVKNSVWHAYKVNIDTLKSSDGIIHFGRILTEGTYHLDELSPFGLLPEQQEKSEQYQKKIGTIKKGEYYVR